MISIRSGKGIGDNIYLQSIVRHFVECGERLEVCTDWPDLFTPIKNSIKISPFRRFGVDRVSHYTTRKNVVGTDQFEDCCINAGVPKGIDLRLDWTPQNTRLLASLRNVDKPIILVQLPREPFGRSDGYGLKLLPDCRRIQQAIDKIDGRAFTVQVGNGDPLHVFSGIDLDLTGKTSVSELIDAGFVADGFLGYCSFFVPLAEAFSKPALFVWSRRGLRSGVEYIRTITPTKILHRASSRFVIDDCSDPEMTEAVDALLDAAGSARALRWKDGSDCRKRAGGTG